jgi:hypothetical protein
MKVNSKFYKGIEYVVVGELPVEQQSLLDQKNTIERIKILMDGKVIGNCISYQLYVDWYHTTYNMHKQRVAMAKAQPQESLSAISAQLKKA